VTRTPGLNGLGDDLAGLFTPSGAGIALGVGAAIVIGAALILPAFAGEKPAKG
jgi:hypothetical protein